MFNAPPSDCLFIGDSAADMEAAQRAGVKSCAVTYGYGNQEDMARWHPDYSANSCLPPARRDPLKNSMGCIGIGDSQKFRGFNCSRMLGLRRAHRDLQVIPVCTGCHRFSLVLIATVLCIDNRYLNGLATYALAKRLALNNRMSAATPLRGYLAAGSRQRAATGR